MLGNKRTIETFLPRNGRKPIHNSLVDEPQKNDETNVNEHENEKGWNKVKAVEDGDGCGDEEKWRKAFFASFSYFPQMHLTIIEVIHAHYLWLSLSLSLSRPPFRSLRLSMRVFSLPHSTFSLYRSFRHLNVWLIVVSVASTLPQRWANDKPSYFFFFLLYSFSFSLAMRHMRVIHPYSFLSIHVFVLWALFLLDWWWCFSHA